jgi:hypothetical protein
VDLTSYDGLAGSLNLQATGGTVTYQWRKDGQPVSGATAASLPFAAFAAGDSGDYDCVATNADGSTLHPPARLTILAGAAPIVRMTPSAVAGQQSLTGVAAANAVGSGPFTYQWYKNGVLIDGATLPSRTVALNSAADGGTFTVNVTNPYGTVVAGAPTIITVLPIQPVHLCGVPYVKIADNNTIKPGRPGVPFTAFTKPKLRDGVLYFLAQDGDPFEFGVYRWENGAFTTVADETVISPDGTPFADCRYPTEQSGGSMAFGARTVGTIAGGSLCIHTASTNTITMPAKYGDAAPGGGQHYGFGHLAKRGSTIFFSGLTFNPGRLGVWKWDGSAMTEEWNDTTALPGAGTFNGFSGDNPQIAFDGTHLAFAAVSSGGGGIFAKTPGGPFTRLVDPATVNPLNTTQTLQNRAVPDLDGDLVIAGGLDYHGTWQPAGPQVSFGSASTVDACGPDSYLRFSPGTSKLEYVSSTGASPWSNATQAVTAALPTPQISGIKEVSGHNKSAALVFTHPANSSLITQSLWIAHNGPVTGAPVITLPPTSQTVNIGARLALRALATGGGLTWEWRRGGTLISTAMHGELLLDPWTAADAGAWTVTVSNTSGSTSANFTLTAATTQITPPSFIAQIPSRHVLPGISVFFPTNLIVHPGGAVVSYQWLKNGLPVPGATASTYSLGAVNASHAGAYSVVVTNAAGSVTSNVAQLTVGLAAAAPPTLAVTQTGSDLHLSFPGVNGRTYRLEESTTLSGWTPLETFTATGTPKAWTYPIGNGKRFYRVVDTTP